MDYHTGIQHNACILFVSDTPQDFLDLSGFLYFLVVKMLVKRYLRYYQMSGTAYERNILIKRYAKHMCIISFKDMTLFFD